MLAVSWAEFSLLPEQAKRCCSCRGHSEIKSVLANYWNKMSLLGNWFLVICSTVSLSRNRVALCNIVVLDGFLPKCLAVLLWKVQAWCRVLLTGVLLLAWLSFLLFCLADFLPSLKSLFGNPVYILYLCASIVQFNSLIGMVTYKPKYIEQQYGQTSSKTNFLIGNAIISFCYLKNGHFTCGIYIDVHKTGFFEGTLMSSSSQSDVK